jgi:hypothetical protein
MPFFTLTAHRPMLPLFSHFCIYCNSWWNSPFIFPFLPSLHFPSISLNLFRKFSLPDHLRYWLKSERDLFSISILSERFRQGLSLNHLIIVTNVPSPPHTLPTLPYSARRKQIHHYVKLWARTFTRYGLQGFMTGWALWETRCIWLEKKTNYYSINAENRHRVRVE